MVALSLAFSTATLSDQAWAKTQVEQIKQANDLLRAAERNMHGGKADLALADLVKAGTLLEAAKAGGETPQLKTALNKHVKLLADVQRRTGQKQVDSAQPQASPGEKATVKMPASVSRQFLELNREMNRTRSSLSYDQWWDLAPSMREGRLQSADENLAKFRTQLDELIVGLDPALADALQVQENKALLAEIVSWRERRGSETEPVADVQPAVAEALAIEEKLLALHTKHKDRFVGVYGSTMINESLLEAQFKQGRDTLAQLDALESEVVPTIQPVLAVIVEKYGDNPMDIDNSLFALGLKNDHFFGGAFRELYSGLENIRKSRQATGQDMAGRAGQTMSGIAGYSEEIRLQRLAEAREQLILGKAFDPANAEINRLLGEMDILYADISASIEADVDARTWVGDINDFPGPGLPNELTGKALEYFRSHPSWNPSGKGVEVLAVALRGPWAVATSDIFGRVLQWRLPIHIAITNTEMKAENIARVYELSILTNQGVPGNEDKKPPFADYWVGNSWNMRLDKTPIQK
ncbi:hypothetical protein C6366_08570 [Desulfonatronum sp. SC1]|nr:hypothetical protein C6366_08570 [Desulfonatronum sp. SC1]